jgi:Holliday junction resolvase RusA-like endonuclease
VQEIVIDAKCGKIEGRLAVFYAFYPPDKRKRDIGNYEKQATDALMEAGLFDDDEQIDFIWLVRRFPIKGGKCLVLIVKHENVGEIINNYEDFV